MDLINYLSIFRKYYRFNDLIACFMEILLILGTGEIYLGEREPIFNFCNVVGLMLVQ